MEFEWDEVKNKANYIKHWLDFSDSKYIFQNPILSKIDDRCEYNEIRHIWLWNLEWRIVIVVYTVRNNKYRIISLRKANEKEQTIYRQNSN